MRFATCINGPPLNRDVIATIDREIGGKFISNAWAISQESYTSLSQTPVDAPEAIPVI